MDDDTIEFLKIDDESVDVKELYSIKNIHNDVLSLQQIFNDLNGIVNFQQDDIDKMELDIENTNIDVEQGYSNIVKADESQQWFRKSFIYTPIILIGSTFMMFELIEFIKK
jgi:t-SNARE complex subunit (syntaxin)